MSVVQIKTIQPSILGGALVNVEVDISNGLHSFAVVGLAGKAIDEAKDRVSSAIKHSGYKSPKSKNQKLVISLSPADLKKEGPLFDLPIAVAYLIATGDIKVDESCKRIFVGELGLDGSLRPVKGVLSIAKLASELDFEEIIVPKENAEEAALIDNIVVRPANNLQEVIEHVSVETNTEQKTLPAQSPTQIKSDWYENNVALEDIKGQESAKRGLTIAAAGGHNIMLVGPPGTGKTLLARALRTLLPPLSREESLEVTAIHSLANSGHKISTNPPFRSPHHTASHTALVGGGSNPKPGEITLAHKGVLFIKTVPQN